MNPDGYWPKDMDASAQYRSMSDFEKAIYPIWKGIEERDTAAEKLMTSAQVNSSPIMFECLTTHKQDLAIHASGHKPVKNGFTPESAQNLRKKAAAGERYQKWSGGE